MKKSHKKWQTSVKKIQTYEKNDTKSDKLVNEKSEICEKIVKNSNKLVKINHKKWQTSKKS